MNSGSPTAAYNLKAVIHETGLKPDTLRAWERRYGLPAPERTAGGHRLYSQRDIDCVRWLIARQDEGLSISHAVNLWRALEAAGEDPLADTQNGDAVTNQAAVDEAPPVVDLTAGQPLAQLRQQWVAACLAFNEPAAQHALNQAFALFAPEHVCFEILQKGVAEIGQGWYEGRVTVQQEHFASALAVRRLDALLMVTPPPNRAGRILVGCPPEEQHTFSPLLLLLLLRRHGWDAIYLGVDVPLQQIKATVKATHADLLILSAQQLHTAASLLEMAQMLADSRVLVAYGGLVFNLLPAIRQRIPAHFLGERLEDAPQMAARLLATRPAQPQPTPLSAVYEDALKVFMERYPLIEAQAWRDSAHVNIPPPILIRANSGMTQNILAALKLGDLNLAAADIVWLEDLLFNHRLPAERDALRQYLFAYREALTRNLAQRGEVLVDWIDRLLQDAAPLAPIKAALPDKVALESFA